MKKVFYSEIIVENKECLSPSKKVLLDSVMKKSCDWLTVNSIKNPKLKLIVENKPIKFQELIDPYYIKISIEVLYK